MIINRFTENYKGETAKNELFFSSGLIFHFRTKKLNLKFKKSHIHKLHREYFISNDILQALYPSTS